MVTSVQQLRFWLWHPWEVPAKSVSVPDSIYPNNINKWFYIYHPQESFFLYVSLLTFLKKDDDDDDDDENDNDDLKITSELKSN